MTHKHKTLDEVRQTIRGAIAMERDYQAHGLMTTNFTTVQLMGESLGATKAFETVLGWLSDLEEK